MTATFGDVTAEYLALRRGVGAYSAHEIVWVKGPDATRFLDGLLSQELEAMHVGSVAPSLLLSPQGKLRAPHWVLKGDDEMGLLTDVGSGRVVIEDLTRFKIRVDATIADPPQPTLDIVGPDAPAILAGLGFEHLEGWRRLDERLAARVPYRRSDQPRFVVAGASLEEVVAAGAVRVGQLAVDAVRIELGEVVNAVDVDEKTIPEEAGLVAGAVDFDKGCYLGQELVARIDSRGHVNRHLRGIEMTTNILPPVGAAVEAAGKGVGVLTSVGESLDIQAPVALSLIRREVEPGDQVTVVWDGGEAPAVVRDLPMI